MLHRIARVLRRLRGRERPGPRAVASQARAARLAGIDALAPGTSGEIAGFGANPGGLVMRVYRPTRAPAPKSPLIVLLHGCGQDAAAFAADGGWTALADRLAIPLVLPEQTARNNPLRCFNWFRSGDIARAGEVQSIREMIAAVAATFDSDPRKVFVVGLSAGAAMATAAMAAYPEVFAAGASVAGLPVGGARGGTTAAVRMAGKGPALSAAEWAARARALAPSHAGRWPRLSIWHGTADPIVAPVNATHLAAQWTALHGVAAAASPDDGDPRRHVWSVGGRAVVELWTIEGMTHGFPIDGGAGTDRYILPAGVDAVAAIARFWGLPGAA